MNAKTGTVYPNLDYAKLTAALLTVVIGIAAFYYFEAYSVLLRVIGLLVLGSVAIALIYQTTIGQKIWQFVLDSKMELHKVVWPTKDETVQTTIVVFVMVLIMGVLLWLFDALLVMIVRALTGQGG